MGWPELTRVNPKKWVQEWRNCAPYNLRNTNSSTAGISLILFSASLLGFSSTPMVITACFCGAILLTLMKLTFTFSSPRIFPHTANHTWLINLTAKYEAAFHAHINTKWIYLGEVGLPVFHSSLHFNLTKVKNCSGKFKFHIGNLDLDELKWILRWAIQQNNLLLSSVLHLKLSFQILLNN